ncbi:Phage-related lysozyme (muramidase), GH24 family [Devosia enhydra]|uniref:Lysozyme n=1 Tax=Devosia enhydra TaxID=665118 RepID=A0A1K2HU41_9HYPH|nr:hypothetical protein [Devosia enhydra]SFZ81656.1 Phage-related lysozyme (muramidase), GH24 family [Devosia enhydra]
MALKAMTSADLLSSFQSSLTATLKAEGLIPMSAGITKPVRVAESFHDIAGEAMAQMDSASAQFGTRAFDRYGSSTETYTASRFAMIASLESISTKSYPDAGGRSVGLGFYMDKEGARDVWSRAFGNTVSFDAVYSGKSTITTAQAKHLFDNDILYYEKVVDRALGGTAVTQNQRLALVSVAYNAPKRLSDLAPVLRSGDNAAITAALLTQTFNPNHSQVEAIKQRRYIETSMFNGTADAAKLMPKFADYYNAVAVRDGRVTVAGREVTPTNTQMNFVPNGSGALKVDIPTDNLAALTYDNKSATRSLTVDPNLEAQIRASVTAVYGADYRVSVISGGQDGSTGRTGSRRHDTMTAADIYIHDPAGNRLNAAQMQPLAQDWIARNIGSVGLPTNGSTQSLHLDLIGGSVPGSTPLGQGEGRFWFYGGEDPKMRATLTSKTAPTQYALSPDAVMRGLVPPGSMPAVGTALAVVGSAPGRAAAIPFPASVDDKLAARAKATGDTPFPLAKPPSVMANAQGAPALAARVEREILGPAKVGATDVKPIQPPPQGLRMPVGSVTASANTPKGAAAAFPNLPAAQMLDDYFGIDGKKRPEVEVPPVIMGAAAKGSPLAGRPAAAATTGNGAMGLPVPSAARPAVNSSGGGGSSYHGGSASVGSGGGTSRSMTVVDQYRSQGYSSAQSYDMANQAAADRARANSDNPTGSRYDADTNRFY